MTLMPVVRPFRLVGPLLLIIPVGPDRRSKEVILAQIAKLFEEQGRTIEDQKREIAALRKELDETNNSPLRPQPPWAVSTNG